MVLPQIPGKEALAEVDRMDGVSVGEALDPQESIKKVHLSGYVPTGTLRYLNQDQDNR